MPWGSSARLEKGLRKSRESIKFLHTCFMQGKACGGMARPVCLREWRPQAMRGKSLDSVSWWNAWRVWCNWRAHICPECRAGGKKPKIGYWLLYQSRDFKKWFLWRKLWALRSGKDCVTWPGGEGIWCAALITMWDHLPPSQQSWAQMRNNREQNMTSSNFGGNSHSVSDILETARGKSERDKVSVSLWPLSSASVRIAD